MDPNPEELYSASELREIPPQALEEVGPALRAVFMRQDIEGLSIPDDGGFGLTHTESSAVASPLQLRDHPNKY